MKHLVRRIVSWRAERALRSIKYDGEWREACAAGARRPYQLDSYLQARSGVGRFRHEQ